MPAKDMLKTIWFSYKHAFPIAPQREYTQD